MSQNPIIQVTGTGTIQAQPDMAIINVGVTTEDQNAANALSRNNTATAKVISELEAANIEKKDVRTSNFSIYPQYRTEGENKHQVTTYRVSNTVTVTVRNLDRIGDILGKVVAAGSNQIYGPSFSVSEPEKFLNEARKKAVENAETKARAYAAAAGLSLGPVIYMSDDTSPVPVFQTRLAAGFAKPASPVPAEAGEESLHAQVTMVFELKPGKAQ